MERADAQHRPREQPVAGARAAPRRDQQRADPPPRPFPGRARRRLDANRRSLARQTQGVPPVTDHHIDPERAQFDAFKALPRDTVIHMLNLVRFRDKAAYPPDHPLAGQGLSGAEAYAHYGRDSGPVFQRLGGRIVWRGTMEAMALGPEAETWDAVFLAEYSTSGAFMATVTGPVYREAVVNRHAQVATHPLSPL